MYLREYIKATEITIIFYFSIHLIDPILSPYIKSLVANDFQLSLIFSITPLILVFASPVMGAISDRLGRVRVLQLGIFSWALALGIYFFATNWQMIILARILNAFAAATMIVAALAKIEDSVDNKTRGRYTGISLSVEYLGRLIAPVLGGVIASLFFIKAPFLVSLIVVIGLLLFLPKEKLKKYKLKKDQFNWFKDIKEFLSYKELRGMAILGVVMHATFPAILVFLPLLITETLGLGYTYVGYAYFFLGISHILQFVFGRWSDIGAYKIVLAGTLTSGIFMMFISQATLYYLLLVFLFFKGLGNSMWNTSAWTLMSNIGENHKIEGEVVGTYFSIAKIGSFSSYIIGGLIVQFFGIYNLFLFNGILIILGSIVAYPLLKKSKIYT